MTKSLIPPNASVENPDVIFYNFVGNFIPPEWRNLTNNCDKRLSTTSRRLLSLIVSCIKTNGYNNTQKLQELQEGYYFFENKLGVCQRRVRQCLLELQTSGFIDFTLTTLIKYNTKCRNILCIKLLKEFISFRKTNDNSHYLNNSNIQHNYKKVLPQPETKYNSIEKKSKKNTSIYISIISRCGKKDCFCGQNCGQSLPELESTKEQSFNLPQEVKVKRGEQNLPELESTKEPSFNLPLEVTVSSGEQNSSELKSTEEQSFNLPQEVTVSSVSETLPYNSPDSNSGDASPTDDESDSDLDLTGGSSGSNEAEQEPEAASWISNIAKKAKGWYSPRKLEEFYPLTEEDAALLRRRTGRNYELSYVNKLLIKHSGNSPNNRFPSKQAVLNYMKKTLIHEMRPPSVANNPNFNFKLDNAIKAREAYLRKIEASKGVNPLNQLQRKIVGAFEPDTAYNLLTRCSFFGVYDDEYKIDLADISLSKTDKDKLLKQVQEVYGKEVQQLRITNKRSPSDYYLELSGLNPESVWYKIRKYLLKLYGELIDKAWFSKLEAIEEDTTCNKLILKPPSPFVGDWIINHYGRVLEEACSSHNYTFEFMKVDRMPGL
ncbi:DnaA N-terminal domain-containing protein [Candidatus Tisiphia endosymbiont of Xenochironomus xenolabis]|uniref:DnaA N-terminal domain-containing protein n=1 Tax=Candidatus Tisiphia endosymbiont of Xenochironomus xenolabis TaxID=3139334 RepID=UPI0035C8FBA0